MNTLGQNGVLPTATLQEAIMGFLNALENSETRGTYRRCLNEFLRWREADRSLRLRREDVERYKRYLTTTKHLSPVSVSTYLTALRRLCAFLVEQGIIAENPAKEVGGFNRPRKHTRACLSNEELARLWETLSEEDERTSRNTAIIRLMVDGGFTETELSRMNVEDYTKEGTNRMLAVQGKGKNAKDARVAVPFESAQALERYLAWRERNLGKSLDPASPLFTSTGNRTRGGRLSARAIRELVNAHLLAAGLKRRTITPLSLRHTAARRMADAGATPEDIRRRMRLGSMQTVFVYLR
jgi:integrase/recombinase XerC